MLTFSEKMYEHSLNSPDRVILFDQGGKRKTTWRELMCASAKIADRLTSEGITGMVSITLGRSMEYVACIIGINMAGLGFIPLSDSYPADRVRQISANANARLIIDKAWVDAALSAEGDADFKPVGDTGTAALIFFTSGSTGNPKGVIYDNTCLTRALIRDAKQLEFGEDCIHAASATFSFSALQADLIAPIFSNSQTHILTDECRKDISLIAEYINSHDISNMFISPQMLGRLTAPVPSLKLVFTGSERVSGIAPRGFDIINSYAMTESTVGVTYFKLDKAYENTPIGKPDSDFTIYLMDENGVPGDEGEICIAGSISRGYNNMPEATAETFTPNPFSRGDGDKILLHTGDLGRRLPDGNLIYLNRRDWMVKINGQRVEPGEVEAVMRAFPAIDKAAVKGFTNSYGQTYLCGYYSLGAPASEDEIRSHIKEKLPSYMQPRFLVKLDALPINQNGKLDRKALLAPDAASFAAEYEAPATEAEQAICRGFEKVLKLERVGANDDFFALGGDSIGTVMLIESVKPLPLKSTDVLEGRTPRKIASIIKAQGSDIFADLPHISGEAPLTDSQMGVYLECAQAPESMMYNIPVCYEFRGENCPDAQALKAAVIHAAGMHPALFARVSDANGDIIMCRGEASPACEILNCSESEIERLKVEFVRPFDLKAGPLCRFEIIQTEAALYLLQDTHHIVSDGASVSLLGAQIGKLLSGQSISPETIDAFALAEIENRRRNSAEYEASHAYFENMLAGNETDSNILPDKKPTGEDNPPSARVEVTLGGALTAQAVVKLTQGAGVTENTLFLASFGYALAKMTGQDESLFCTVDNGRDDPRLSDTVSMLVRTLPVSAKFDENMDAIALLKQVQRDFFATMRHDAYSFEAMAREYGVRSDILYVYQAQTLSGMRFGENYAPMAAIETGCALANLSAMVFRRGDEYTLSLEYRADMYERATIERFAALYIAVLNGFMRGETLRDIALLSETDGIFYDRINATEHPYDASKTIIDLFREQTQRTPNNIAVVFKDKRFTYAELDAISDRIAAHIHGMGIGNEDIVSVLIPRCEYMPIASLGVLKAGAGYQPLDPTYPMDRLAFMMKDAGAKLLIADEEMLALVPEYAGKVLLTRDIPSLPTAPLDFAPPAPDDLFIILYTSGSTGVPKGCMIEHGNIAAFCNWFMRQYELDENCAAAAYASYGFDANMMDTYPTLLSGATLHIIPEEMRLELVTLNEYFNHHNITHAFMTTQVGRQFASEIEDNHSLRFLLVGGEKLVPLSLERSYRFFNLYGPTECTVLSTFFEVDKLYESVPIGRSLSNMKLYVLDKQGRRVPVGVPGELCISGPQVSRGYLGRPEQTRAAYSENPFTGDPAYARIYHSGDIVRMLPDGNIEFVGRKDAQVKIRGFRIELTEVEGVIREYPGITDVTVIAKDAPAGGKMVLAYVVSSEKVDVAQLNAFILERKPPYMVPAATMQIDKIPLNPNMKVDKRKLPDIKLEAAADDAPRQLTRLETALFDIVKSIVGHDSFGVSTDLGMAGITSLSAIKLATTLNNRYGFSPNVKSMLKGATILTLEDGIIEHLLSSGSADSQAQAGPALDKYPLTQTQLGIYLDCMRDGSSDAYNIPLMYRMPVDIDADKLRAAIRAAIDAHASVKCFVKPDASGDICMYPQPELNWDIESIALSESQLPPKLTHFEFSDAPLFRVRLISTESALYLMLEFHHIIADGESVSLLLEDIDSAYAGTSLKPESYTAFDLALDESKARKTDALSKAKAYYDTVFKGVAVESLPDADVFGRPSCLKTLSCPIDANPGTIRGLCGKFGVTENALFTGALGLTLARFAGSDEALFTSIYNGRTDARTFNMMGMLVKTFPVYASVTGGMGVKQFLSGMKEHISALMANDIYSFAEISRAYGIASDIIFAYQGEMLSGATLCGHSAQGVPLRLEALKAPLNIDVFAEESRFRMDIEYDGGRYSNEFMQCFADAYAMCVKGMLSADTLGDIDITSPAALEILARFNDTDWQVAPRPAYRLLQDSAAVYTERTAVIACGEKLTYAQLNARANQLGRSLRKTGLDVEGIAGVLLERSKYVYIARQGVLKAGGAFLPIDPEYPDDRIEYVLGDSGARHLITTRDIYERRKQFIDGLALNVCLIDELPAGIDASDINVPIGAQALAYCIYTSGSTGKPKGVMLTQHNLVNFVDANPCNHEILGYTEYGHVSLALAAITFDVSIMEEFIPLAHGMTICMANHDEIHNPLALRDLCLANNVDMVSCTPSFLLNILDIPELKPVIERIRSIDLGAEAFPASLYLKLRALNPTVHIMNGYGPTEATISCSMAVIESGEHITIGIPNANVKIVMVDERNRILPPGALGEMVIMGAGVGRGYINRDDLNREKFIELCGLPAYKSGDLARITAAGEIEFHGRTDNQVKLRGLRVELGEIESAINNYEGIKSSIVLMKENEAGQFLAGYFTADREIDIASLTAFISQSLTYYMVPSVLIQLEAFPLTANGKIDKHQLPDATFAVAQREYIAPTNDIERAFCDEFKSILGVDRVGATDDFFELGGTSLSASKVAMFAMTNGYPIVYADVFKYPTARALAERCGCTAEDTIPAADPIADYDYDQLSTALASNSLCELDGVSFSSIGNLLLTGATGFLGVHVLKRYLETESGTAYCFMRRGRFATLEKRLSTMLMYYFSDTYEKYMGNRIVCIEGDISDAASVAQLSEVPFDTLINCAACVKHFTHDDTLERANVLGVKNLIDLCLKHGRRLVQVSTVSIAGEGMGGSPAIDKRIHENELYFGQALENAYINTKFRAERLLLEAVGKGLDGKIMRVGNLMSRDSDGEFQINYLTNGFMRQLRGYKIIGKFPLSLMSAPAEFSPIDSTAAAILRLSGTGRAYTVFHPYNNHTVRMADVVLAMNVYGFDIKPVSDDEFHAALVDAMNDPTLSNAMGGLIAYLSHDSDGRYLVDSDNDFTSNALYRLGWFWPITSMDYLNNSIAMLAELGFFDSELL